MLVTMNELLTHAKKNNYAVAAPSCFNKESIRACFEAADTLGAPIILNVGFAHGIEESAYLAKFYEAKYPNVIYALNLDHGGEFSHIMRAIQSGFSSVRIDRSTLSLEDNIREVKEVVKIAHALGITVEAELGHVGNGAEYETSRNSGLTRVDDAVQFIQETNIDCLAVAIGTSHGVYNGNPEIDFKLLEDIANVVDIPLVLHGGSGTGEDNLAKTIKSGIQKINLWTDLGNSWIDALEVEIINRKEERSSETDTEFKMRKKTIQQLLDDSIEVGYKRKLISYMKLFNSEGKSSLL